MMADFRKHEDNAMPMTITEKILAAHAGRDRVTPGETIWVDADVFLTHDVCGPGTIGIFHEHFGDDARVFDPNKVVIIPDHYIFTADPKAHRNVEILRKFAAEQQLPHYYDPDFMPDGLEGVPTPYASAKGTDYRGVCHAALPELGHVRPGEVLFGTDSHTCMAGAWGMFATGIGNTDGGFILGAGKLWVKAPESMKFVFTGHVPPYLMAKDLMLRVIGEIGFDGATYRAMEFAGEALMSLNMDERSVLTNMAIEAGGKNGIIAADEVTTRYVEARTDKPFTTYQSDPDAEYHSVYEFHTPDIKPTVALPHNPGNRACAEDLGDVKIDRAYIGSCTGGKKLDLLAAAKLLAGKRVSIDTFVVPATTIVDQYMDEETLGGRTLREIFTDAGCEIGPASCAACLGGPEDTFGRANEPINVISATNRNFPGRMGHLQAGVYLASPLTVAATAIEGNITDPRKFVDWELTLGHA